MKTIWIGWLLFAGQCFAADDSGNWPQFRGPNGSGVADAQKPPIHFGPSSNLLWKISLPSGMSSPCIWGDRVFLTGFENERLDTLCIRRSDGKMLWRKTAPAKQIETYFKKEGSPAASTPVTDGQRVYVYFGSFGLLCYDFEGREQWKTPLPIAESFGGFGTGTSPILADGLIIINRDQMTNSFVIAVDRQTGQPAWKTVRADFSSSWSTPAVWKHDSATEVVVAGSLLLKAYDLKTGTERWTVRGLPAATCTTPIVDDGFLFVAAWSSGGSDQPFPKFDSLLQQHDKNGDGILDFDEVDAGMKDFFHVYDFNKDKRLTRDEWEKISAIAGRGKNALVAIRPGGKGDITETHVAWSQTKGLPYVPSPIAYRGRIYLVKDGGIASCFDVKTGKIFYLEERLGAEGSYYASPVAANGHIYATSLDGTTVVFEVGDHLNVKARNRLGERVAATPAIVDDKIYIRGADHLFAFGTKEK